MRLVPTLLIGLIGAAILVSLGVWQVQRLAWKEGVLAEIEARIVADPVALPANPSAETDLYLPVEMSGHTGERELHVLISTRKLGPGFRIVTAFETLSGRRVLLDQGVVPDEDKDAPRAAEALTVRGNLHWPDDRDSFTPENDVEANYWYARDLDRMAAELGTEPILVVARATVPPKRSVTPLPVDTAGIPNDHLGYAVTWFGLAIVWLGMTALQLWRISRRTP
ncbi:surfeit locus 1 family protein [Aliiruegeria haliotis]|uniref:SURF1-like protein n=1 Tax=Aliiruegeria haliotis TaxID=1280846 RepID=A0A2T0RVA8_9RHOB|nr:SURF1 family protein [Aliiruegeria haliotis]PRY25078.1 surfeit locus 1 family protein [Aliiruegeria haliotis]